MGVFNGNGEFKSTVSGLLLIGGGWAGLYLDLLPWWTVVFIATPVGFYFLLPETSRSASDWLAELGEKALNLYKDWKSKD